MPVSEVFNEDCMVGMARYPDKFFDLAIVDPPYGIGATSMNLGNSVVRKKEKVNDKTWDDSAPDVKYFMELLRISKNQIIWGINHYAEQYIKNSSGWIVWHKNRNNNDFADCELAYTSFDKPARLFQFDWNGFRQGYRNSKEEKIHINQKPVALYSWILKNYAETGSKIIDTHLGSGSSRIAAYKTGFDFWGWEIDKEYFNNQNIRFKKEIAEPLFQHIHPTQSQIF
jgi:site-specific DNA-methyltransferase (adenine-specific)